MQSSIAAAAEALDRTPIVAKDAFSGAWLERVRLADGRRLVLKHLPAEGDWLTRLTDGLGRARWLWDSGLLSRLESVVEHAVIGVERIGAQDTVVMNDVTDRLWPPSQPLSVDQVQAALGGLGRLHEVGSNLVGADFDGSELCAVGARYAMTSPAWHAGDVGPHPLPSRARILTAWDIFFDTVDDDVAEAVAAVHTDPLVFGQQIQTLCQVPTVLHGDAKPENLGVTAGRLTAIDWGELTGFGPREVDVVWFALMSTRSRLAAQPNDIVSFYERSSRVMLDPVIVDLACIGSLAQMGWWFAHLAYNSSHLDARQRGATLLAWWSSRVRVALDRGVAPGVGS